MATNEVVPPAGPMLPSRYEQVLNQRVAEHAQKMVANAQAARAGIELPKWGMPVAVLGLGAVAALILLARQERTDRSTLPVEKGAVISTGSVGVQASAEEMIPKGPSPRPGAPAAIPSPGSAGSSLLRDVVPSPKPSPKVVTAAAAPRKDADCPSCRPRAAASPAPSPAVLTAPVPTTLPAPPKPALNVGSRFQAVLAYEVNTAYAGAPVTAQVPTDIAPNGPVAIPAGSTLVGEAFATDSDDRAQIIFSALVRDGRTVPFRGIAMGPDNNLGLRGKVVRKASAKKKGAGRVLGAVGSAVTFGLAGKMDGVVGDATAALASQSAMDLNQLDRSWSTQRSDKVVQVKAQTPVTVYVQSDLSGLP
jgi:hypothetical protein